MKRETKSKICSLKSKRLFFKTFLLQQTVGSGMKLSQVFWAQEQLHFTRVKLSQSIQKNDFF